MSFTPSITQLEAMEALALSLVPKRVRRPATPKKKKTKELTEKGRQVLAYVKAHFGNAHWKGLGKILGVILDDPCLEAELVDGDNEEAAETAPSIPGFWNADAEEFTKGAAVVPLKDTNGHGNELCSVIIMMGTGRYDGDDLNGLEAFELDERDGMFMYNYSNLGTGVGEWRPATATEIRAFFKKARKSNPYGAPNGKLPW